MASHYDETDFVDREFPVSDPRVVTAETPAAPEPVERSGNPALTTQQDLENRVCSTQQRLAELKRQQQQLEEQRIALEEARYRRKEFHDGKTEMQRQLPRGIEMLEEASVNLQRESTQMKKTLEEFRQALEKIGSFSEETWTAENVEIELSRALTAIENGRMEWNAARLKWPFLDGQEVPELGGGEVTRSEPGLGSLQDLSFLQLCKLGFTLTWPVAVSTLAVSLVVWISSS